MVQLECANIRSEIERRLLEKDDEFENTRHNHQKIIESMQASLDAEQRSRAESARQKKKLEGDINQLEAGLDHANRQLAEAQKANKRLSGRVSELSGQLEDEQAQRAELREQVVAAERRMQTCGADLEDARSALDVAEKGRKSVELELHEAADRVAELTASCASAVAAKRQVETSLGLLRAECEEALGELKASEERARKFGTDCARVAEELRAEQVGVGMLVFFYK